MRSILLLVPLLLPAVHGQPRHSLEPGRNSRPDRGLDVVISLARAAPPEFGADVLIRMVEAGIVKGSHSQRELLDQAFLLATYAQESTPLKSVELGGSKTFSLNAAFAQGLDRVSLRARVVRVYLRSDVQRARELFETIDMPDGVSSTCSDEFTFDPSIYYSTLSALLNAGLTPEEVQRILLMHMTRLRSTAQLEPFIRVLVESKNLHNTAVIDSLAERLTRLDQNDRTFSACFPGAVVSLGKLCASVAVGVRERLVQQARLWVLQGLKHGLCSHRPVRARSLDGTMTPVLWVSPSDLFNQVLASKSLMKPTIESRDFTVAPMGPRAALPVYSDDWQRFSRMETLLAHESEEEKDAPRWKSEMEKYIALIGEWKGTSDEGPYDYYTEKCDLLSAVLKIPKYHLTTPSTPSEVNAYWAKMPTIPRAELLGRDRVMLEIVEHFDGSAGNAVYRERRIAWFAPVRRMLGSFDRSDETLAFAELYARAHHVVLNLYGKFALLVSSR